MKSLFETLASLTTVAAGAALITGCGASPAPVNASEVPAATESKPAAAADVKIDPAKPMDNSMAAPAAPAAGTAASATAAATPAGTAKPAAKPADKKKVGAKKTGAQGDCGAGTCSN
jgi:hypothetical protein